MSETKKSYPYDSHPDTPVGSWCATGDPECGEPNADGIASFCGEACWKAAGSPKPLASTPR